HGVLRGQLSGVETVTSGVMSFDALFDEAGFVSDGARQQARAVLEAHGLTRPGKRNISTDKLPRVYALFAATFSPSCGHAECMALLPNDGRAPITVAGNKCPVCGGSNDRRAAALLAQRMRERGKRRLLVVGGSVEQHGKLRQLLPELELRFVDAANRVISERDARPDLQWAEIIAVWGSTELPHKVSNLFTGPKAQAVTNGKIVQFARRSIDALCREVVRALD
ncbi:MAG: hypothetical protein NZ518_06160, partial [Dehalococcoidia bacterium]|nr:hypothetical protein [Dehalococcoidia bacterium]